MTASAAIAATGASVVAAGDATTIALIVIASLLALAWVVSLVVLVFDPISIGAKVVVFLALTLLAPVAIPLYLLWRVSRRRAVPDTP